MVVGSPWPPLLLLAWPPRRRGCADGQEAGQDREVEEARREGGTAGAGVRGAAARAGGGAGVHTAGRAAAGTGHRDGGCTADDGRAADGGRVADGGLAANDGTTH